MMSTSTSRAFFLLFFAAFFVPASAELLVGIEPKDLNTPNIYVNETADFTVSIFNPGNQSVQNVSMKATVDEGLSLIENEHISRQSAQTIPEIKPLERKRIFLKVKGGESAKNGLKILVEYGLGNNLSSSVNTLVNVVDGPLLLDAKSLRSTIGTGDKTSVVVNIKNTGRVPLRNIVVELVLPAGVTPYPVFSSPLIVPQLNPGEEVVDKGLGFEFDPAISGPKTIIVRASFFEGNTFRSLEKRVVINTGAVNPLVIGLVLVVVVLVIIALIQKFWKRKKQK